MWQSMWPLHALSWALFATKGAITTTHVDAGGLCTRIHVKKGWKMWFVMLNPPLPLAGGWDGKRHKGIRWQMVPLGPGEDLWVQSLSLQGDSMPNFFFFRFMRPGTPHFVVGVDDCMIVGGHFYNKNNFEATMVSMVMEHYMGTEITNTEHPTSPLILFKLLCSYVNVVKVDPDNQSLSSSTQFEACQANRMASMQACQMIVNWLP